MCVCVCVCAEISGEREQRGDNDSHLRAGVHGGRRRSVGSQQPHVLLQGQGPVQRRRADR